MTQRLSEICSGILEDCTLLPSTPPPVQRRNHKGVGLTQVRYQRPGLLPSPQVGPWRQLWWDSGLWPSPCLGKDSGILSPNPFPLFAAPQALTKHPAIWFPLAGLGVRGSLLPGFFGTVAWGREGPLLLPTYAGRGEA